MPGSEVSCDYWMTEYVTPADVYMHGVSEVLHFAKTAYQEMSVVRSPSYGKALVLDGKWQSCMAEEFIYHEPLVHVPCILHGAPEQILVLGGGEGATLREALKWKTAKRVVMVDIDGEVVEACKRHLPEMHQGAFDDPRTELIIGDALDYIAQAENVFDVIISDLTDPLEEGPSFALFTREYFEDCARALKDGGIFVLQSGPVAPPLAHMFAKLASTVRAVFADMAFCLTPTFSYGSPWGVVVGRKGQSLGGLPDPGAVDALMAERTQGEFRFVDGIGLRGLLSPPKYLRDAVARETEVYTKSRPPRFGKEAE